MPTGVFPSLGYYGESDEDGVERFTRTFADGSYRTYLEGGGAELRTKELVFNGINKDERIAYNDFVKTHNKAATIAAFEFYLYDSLVRSTVDLSGADATGRLVAIFLASKIKWSRDGPCRWSGRIPVFIVQ